MLDAGESILQETSLTMESIFFYQTDIGRIGIVESGNAVTHLYFQGVSIPEGMAVKETPLLREAGKQLQEYLAGDRQIFSIPLAPEGTVFMKRVWDALCAIPYGETRSYQQVAQYIENPNASRAVGLANHRNPIPIFIPCHRVIGANGRLIGYLGGLQAKEHLLNLEKR